MANAINSLNYGDNTYTFTLPYGVCATEADTAAKEVTVDNFSLEAGAVVVVKFTYANSVASPTLNVNGTGAKPIYRYGTTVASTGTTTTGWIAGAVQMFVYDGTGWIRDYWNNSTYSNASLGQGYATCTTAAATTAKVGTLSSYSLTTGGVVSVKFTYAVPANATLNINSKGAKNIYYRGAKITADVIKAGDIATFIYSSQYHLIAIDRWQKDIGDILTELDTKASSSDVTTALAGKSDTNHTHGKATISSDGLMSAEDKIQLDNGGHPIVTTSGTGAAYTATVDGITALTNGIKITIIPHAASTTTTPTLNVNGLGAKYIRMPVTYNTGASSGGAIAAWLTKSRPVTLQYNGTYWLTVDMPKASALYLHGTVPIENGGTGATTAADALASLGAVSTNDLNSKLQNSKADWNQNDENALNHVKNRPIYSMPEKISIVEEQTVTLEYDDVLTTFYNVIASATIESGKKYIIGFEGAAYECVAREEDSLGILIGNGTIGDGDGDYSNGEPFLLLNYDGDLILYCDSEGSYTISVYTEGDMISRTIDNEYVAWVDTRLKIIETKLMKLLSTM